MSTCPRCQQPVDGPDRLCPHCGAPLAAAGAPPPAGTLGGARYQIVGYEMQAAAVTLAPGQAVMAEPGAMLYMRGGVNMATGMTGGLMAGFKRALAGDSFFLAHFNAE